jgi:hypothetical protein
LPVHVIKTRLTGHLRRYDHAVSGQAGISVGRAGVFATHAQISGQDVGVAIFQGNSDGRADFSGDDLLIEGGSVGLAFDGIENALTLHNSTIRFQTVAALHVGSVDSPINLGDAFTPGNNALSVVSGFALDDGRNSTASSTSTSRLSVPR